MEPNARLIVILIVIAAFVLGASVGCSWRYGTAPFSFNGKQYDIVCPDPPPQHPDVIVGSTPCVYVLRKH
jgi:hypothetical protein